MKYFNEWNFYRHRKASSENGEMKSNEQLESSLEERIEELRHRLRIEAAVVDGAKNVIRTLQSNKTIDKKALQEVSGCHLLLIIAKSSPTKFFEIAWRKFTEILLMNQSMIEEIHSRVFRRKIIKEIVLTMIVN